MLCFCSATTSIASEQTLVLDHRDKSEIYQIGAIQIIDPWVKSPIGAHHLKLFFEFRNGGLKDDRLVLASSPLATKKTRFFAVNANQHATNGLSEISRIDVPSGNGSFELSENGYYIQLNGLSRPVVMGSRVPIVLVFEQAGRIEMEVAARFHSPKLHQRIKNAVDKGDIEGLRKLQMK